MKSRLIIGGLFFLFSSISIIAQAQTFLKGKVVDDLYDRVVMGATIKNLQRNTVSQSDMGGNYKIVASAGDKILFSSVGYLPDSITVTADMLSASYDIALTRNVVLLDEVQVGQLNPYQVDSIARREEFNDALETSTSKVVGGKGNTISDGVGVTFSPISHFSKGEKNIRRFKRTYAEHEREYYVDYKFSLNQVAKLTHLTGDSLRSFMLTYRPSYDFCRKASFDDMLVYINDNYRQYMNRTAAPGSEKKKKKKKG